MEYFSVHAQLPAWGSLILECVSAPSVCGMDDVMDSALVKAEQDADIDGAGADASEDVCFVEGGGSVDASSVESHCPAMEVTLEEDEGTCCLCANTFEDYCKFDFQRLIT